MILTKLRVFPAPAQRRQILELLSSVLGRTRLRRSCLSAQVYEEIGEQAAILYLEEWESEPEFCEHVRSDLYRHILAAIDLSNSPPEICFDQVSHVQGLELVQQLRGSGRECPAAPPQSA